MKYRLSTIFLTVFLIVSQSNAQTAPRILGARGFQCDDGTGSGYTMTWDVNHLTGPLTQSYAIHWPNSLPASEIGYCAVDPDGNMWWSEYLPLPSLSPGSIWYGNSVSVATELPPGPLGSILTIGAGSMPVWTTVLPSPITISASQITSGTIQPGVTIQVGNGGTIFPTGTGSVTANELAGAGFGKYAGQVPIPTGADFIDIPFAQIQNGSVVNLSVSDPQSGTYGYVSTSLQSITSGVGFRVTFAAAYPPSGTGILHYTIVNP